MKRLFLVCALLWSFIAGAQSLPQGYPFFTKDSLPLQLKNNWRFHLGDSANWADPTFNDSAWQVTSSELRMLKKPAKATEHFNSVAWLRYTFIADTSITNKPLALMLTQYGASQVFLDGRMIEEYGVINGKDSTDYFDPQNRPNAFVLSAPGRHVIAVRYANYRTDWALKYYHRNFAGFKMKMGEANQFIISDYNQTAGQATIFMFMFGLFIALSIIHLCLYLYYRAARSNMYFSIFCFCLSLLFFIPFLNHFSYYPAVQLNNVYLTLIVSAVSPYAFSGLTNEIFSKGKLRFRVITVLCIIAPLFYFFYPVVSTYMLIAIVGFVSLESIILIIRAIYLKVQGARIIGVGVLPLGVFFFIAVVLLIFQEGSIDINDDNLPTQIVEFIGLLAILSLPISISIYLAWSFAKVNKDLKAQLEQVQILSEKSLQQEHEKKLMLENRKEELEVEVASRTEQVVAQKHEIEQQHEQLKVEKKKTDDLLLNILPEEIAEELKQKGTSEAKYFDHVSVLFTDFVNFTKAGERMTAQELVDELHECFKAFDGICSKYNIEKIKTIGDAYLAVCGLPAAHDAHAVNVVSAAIEIRDFMAQRKQQIGDRTFGIRIGIHSGSVVAGIVGVKKFAYDIWGDTVNTAARMEQHSEPGRINVSEATYTLIKDSFTCTHRGMITAKNKGEMHMYFVDGLNHDSLD